MAGALGDFLANFVGKGGPAFVESNQEAAKRKLEEDRLAQQRDLAQQQMALQSSQIGATNKLTEAQAAHTNALTELAFKGETRTQKEFEHKQLVEGYMENEGQLAAEAQARQTDRDIKMENLIHLKQAYEQAGDANTRANARAKYENELTKTQTGLLQSQLDFANASKETKMDAEIADAALKTEELKAKQRANSQDSVEAEKGLRDLKIIGAKSDILHNLMSTRIELEHLGLQGQKINDDQLNSMAQHYTMLLDHNIPADQALTALRSFYRVSSALRDSTLRDKIGPNGARVLMEGSHIFQDTVAQMADPNATPATFKAGVDKLTQMAATIPQLMGTTSRPESSPTAPAPTEREAYMQNVPDTLKFQLKPTVRDRNPDSVTMEDVRKLKEENPDFGKWYGAVYADMEKANIGAVPQGMMKFLKGSQRVENADKALLTEIQQTPGATLQERLRYIIAKHKAIPVGDTGGF